MKLKKKIISLMLAVAVVLGALGLPTLTNLKALAAQTSATVGAVHSVKKDITTAEFSVGQDITFANYFANGAGEACVWAPNGTVVKAYNSADLSYTFTSAGLYAVQFRWFEGTTTEGFYAYSDQFFVPVSSAFADIELKQTITETARTNSTVTIPTPVDSDVTVKVYSSYGEEVTVQNNQFTNLVNVVGTYYIEYKKMVGGTPLYNYLTVVFGNDYPANVIKDVEVGAESKEVVTLSDDLAQIKKDGTFNLFKPYSITAKNTEDANITIKAYKTVDGTRSALSSDELNGTTLLVKSFAGLAGLTGKGYKYEFEVYNSTDAEPEQSTLVETITVNPVFDATCVTIESDDLVVDYLTVIEDLTHTINAGKLNILSGFDKQGIEAYFDPNNIKIEVNYIDSNGNTASLADNTDGHFTFEESTRVLTLAEEKTYADLKYKKLKVTYTLTFDASDNDSIDGSLTKDYYINLVESADDHADNTRPSNIELGSLDAIIVAESKITVPTLTAKDVDNNNATTNGYKVSVVLNNGVVANQTVTMGQELTAEAIGVNTLTYTVTDSSGNTTTRVVSFKVVADNWNTENTTTLTVGTSDVQTDLVNEERTFTLTGSNATNVVIYANNKVASSPMSVTYANGVITSFTVDTKVMTDDVVAVLSATTATGFEYIAVTAKTQDFTQVEIKNAENKMPFSFNKLESNKSYQAKMYSTLKVNVGDSVLWFEEGEFTVKTEENGLYKAYNANQFVPLTVGTYTISQNDVDVAVITVQEGTIAQEKYEQRTQLVVTNSNQPVTVYPPYLPNYFGYTLNIAVEGSRGNNVNFENNQFNVSKIDNYKVIYSFILASTTKTVTEYVNTGDIINPVITIFGSYKSVEWTGEKIRIDILSATAKDKFNSEINVVNIQVKDDMGNLVEIKTDSSTGGKYIEVVNAGIYEVYYTAVDSDGLTSTERVNFAILFPEEAQDDGLSAGQIVAIVIAGVVCVAIIALIVLYKVKNNKKKNKFVNKNKVAKKEKESATVLYTVVENKDGETWVVKRNNRVLAKAKTKEEALEKINAEKVSAKKVKVYNKSGRLIDSID